MEKFFVLSFGLLFCLTAYSDPPIEDSSRTFLQLRNGTWLYLNKIGWEKIKFTYGRANGNEKKKDIIWSKIYESNDERPWEYAYFLRLRPGHFVCDLDGDGNKEIGGATYDMGNNMFR